MFLRTCMNKIMSTDGNQTDRQTDRQIDRQTDRQTDMSGRMRQYTPELRSQ